MVRRLNRGQLDDKLTLARVLGDQPEAELEVLKPFGANIAHRLALLDGQGDQAISRRRLKAELQSMGLLEPPAKFMHHLRQHRALLFALLRQQLLELRQGLVHQLGIHHEPLHLGGRQLEFQVAEGALAHGHQPASASLLVSRAFRDPPQTIVLEENLDPVGPERLFVLSHDAAFRTLQNLEQIVDLQRMADHPDRQTPDELGFEAEIDEITGLRQIERSRFIRSGLRGRRKPNGRFAQPFSDDLFKSIEGPAHHEQDVLGVDAGWLFAPPALRHFHHGLDLARDIVRRTHRYLRLLHQLEEVRLHTPPADVAPRGLT